MWWTNDALSGSRIKKTSMHYCENIAETWSTKDITCWRSVAKNTKPKTKKQTSRAQHHYFTNEKL